MEAYVNCKELIKVRDFSISTSMLTLQLLFPFWVTWVLLMIPILCEMYMFYVHCQTVQGKKKQHTVEMRKEHNQQY